MYLWLAVRPLVSPVAVLAVAAGLYGHEEDLLSEGTVGLSDESDLTSLLSTMEGPGRELCPGGTALGFTLDKDGS